MEMKSKAARLALELFHKAVFPDGFNDKTAWLGIYQVLLWYEEQISSSIKGLPHIIDADKLHSPRAKPEKESLTIWQSRAQSVEKYLASKLHCNDAQVIEHVDKLMRHQLYAGSQRQNPLGNAFPVLICHILEVLGNSSVIYELEQSAQSIFPGIQVPGRSPNPKIDIVVHRDHALKAVISCKWSLRHDRLNDISNECPAYKNAANWTRTNIDYLVVTNEYDPARLQKVITDKCVDALVHVHKPLPVEVCGLNSRLKDMLDFSDLIARSKTW